jgi:hypothetical protein
MEIKHVQPAGMRPASVLLTISIVCLCITIPTIVIIAVILFGTSILFNDSGNVPQQVAPYLGGILLFDAGLVVLLVFSIRMRRHLTRMMPSARKGMLIFGAVYVVIALCILPFPFPDPLALIPGALGGWWLFYFSRPETRLAFENASLTPPTPPIEQPIEAAPPAP